MNGAVVDGAVARRHSRFAGPAVAAAMERARVRRSPPPRMRATRLLCSSFVRRGAARARPPRPRAGAARQQMSAARHASAACPPGRALASWDSGPVSPRPNESCAANAGLVVTYEKIGDRSFTVSCRKGRRRTGAPKSTRAKRCCSMPICPGSAGRRALAVSLLMQRETILTRARRRCRACLIELYPLDDAPADRAARDRIASLSAAMCLRARAGMSECVMELILCEWMN